VQQAGAQHWFLLQLREPDIAQRSQAGTRVKRMWLNWWHTLH